MLTILAELMHKYKKSLNQQQSGHSKAANKSSTSTNNNNLTAEKQITAKSSSTFEEILLSFRLTENFQRALKLDKSDSFLGVIAGLRTIICLWVTVFHVYYYSLFALTNTALVFAKLEQFILQPVIQACFYVDIFFVISALLHVSNFLANAKQLQLIRNGNFLQNFVLFCKIVFYRYLRLTPVMIITLLLSDMLNDFLNMYSPFYLGPHSGIYCKTNWWYNLLYIHNILDMENICCSWTWYLACEMQFYILFTVLLFIHAKNAKAAKIAFAVLTLGFVAIAWLCNYRNGITFQIDVIHSTLSQLYVKSWVRCVPYIVGVAFGWLMHYYRHHHHHRRRHRHHQQNQQYWQRQQQQQQQQQQEQLQYEHRLQKQLQQQEQQQQQVQVQQLEHHAQYSGVESTTVDLRVSVWRAVFWLFLATIYVFTNFMSYWRSTPSWLVAIIMSFGKLLFAICIGGVILLCAFGHGGYFDALLSARPFLFMNKFCFSVYMVAPVIVFASFGLRSEATNFTEVGSGMDFLAIILLSMAGAFLLVLLVELPMQRIANILLRPKSVHQRVDKSVNSS
ncbi:uncharacterized protein LOC119684825 [Teleopsis dalmanni]|uniref:uncharacterized protein LOC119684825 n=1 Tax=Teleopsis dalmanni TaxID=139649 RepID=UPI0018CDB623|nr:uncharacterized protein LOC119684825 [Teleopsis dalmanni]